MTYVTKSMNKVIDLTTSRTLLALTAGFLLTTAPSFGMEMPKEDEKNQSQSKTETKNQDPFPKAEIFVNDNEKRKPVVKQFLTIKIKENTGSVPSGETGVHKILHSFVSKNSSVNAKFLQPALEALRDEVRQPQFDGVKFLTRCSELTSTIWTSYATSKSKSQQAAFEELIAIVSLATSGYAHSLVLNDMNTIRGNVINKLDNIYSEEVKKLEEETQKAKEEQKLIIENQTTNLRNKNFLSVEGAKSRAEKDKSEAEKMILELELTLVKKKTQLSKLKEYHLKDQEEEFTKALGLFDGIYKDFNQGIGLNPFNWASKGLQKATLQTTNRTALNIFSLEEGITKSIAQKTVNDLKESLKTRFLKDEKDINKLFEVISIDLPTFHWVEKKGENTNETQGSLNSVQLVVAGLVGDNTEENETQKKKSQLKKRDQNK